MAAEEIMRFASIGSTYLTAGERAFEDPFNSRTHVYALAPASQLLARVAKAPLRKRPHPDEIGDLNRLGFIDYGVWPRSRSPRHSPVVGGIHLEVSSEVRLDPRVVRNVRILEPRIRTWPPWPNLHLAVDGGENTQVIYERNAALAALSKMRNTLSFRPQLSPLPLNYGQAAYISIHFARFRFSLWFYSHVTGPVPVSLQLRRDRYGSS